MAEPAQPSPPSGQAFSFPPDKNRYACGNEIGTAAGASVYAAHYIPTPGTGENRVPVTIKVFQLDQVEDVPKLTQEIHLAETGVNQNIVKVHCSFESEAELWVVMSNSGFVSLSSLMPSSAPSGLSESAIAYILREVLKGLHWIHNSCNVLHEKIDFDCVFLNENSEVKLAGSLSYNTNESNSRQVARNNEGDDRDWMLAPELWQNLEPGTSSRETDIWLFGLFALKLRFGRVPAKDYEDFRSLILGIERNFGTNFLGKLHGGLRIGQRSCEGISRPFGKVLCKCLSRKPGKRATTTQLLEFKFFSDCCGYGGQNLRDQMLQRPSMNTQATSSAGHPRRVPWGDVIKFIFQVSHHLSDGDGGDLGVGGTCGANCGG